MQNLTVSDSLGWICAGDLRELNEIYGFLKNIWVLFLQRKSALGLDEAMNHWALPHKHFSEKVKEPYLVNDLYVKRARETVSHSRSMWLVGKQLGHLFKQSWLLLLFTDLQLGEGWNNSTLPVTYHHGITVIGLEGNSRDHLAQPSPLLRAEATRAGCSGSCLVRFECCQWWRFHSLSGQLDLVFGSLLTVSFSN